MQIARAHVTCMYIAGKAEYERKLQPRDENAKYLQNNARLVNSDFTNAFCFALLLRPRMDTTFLDWFSAIRPHENGGKVESNSICIRKSQRQRNLGYPSMAAICLNKDCPRCFAAFHILSSGIYLHFLCSCRKQSHL